MREAPVTDLLKRWSTGDRDAAEAALPLVYDELRRIAARELRRGRRGHTLQATAIVHEVYLRLSGQEGLRLSSRAHFFALAARLTRQILVDYARRQNRLKRGGKAESLTLTEMAGVVKPPDPDLLALDEALDKLEALDPRKAAIVELRFFAGLTLEETAAQLAISPETVGREWRRARAWLRNELESGRPLSTRPAPAIRGCDARWNGCSPPTRGRRASSITRPTRYSDGRRKNARNSN